MYVVRFDDGIVCGVLVFLLCMFFWGRSDYGVLWGFVGWYVRCVCVCVCVCVCGVHVCVCVYV